MVAPSAESKQWLDRMGRVLDGRNATDSEMRRAADYYLGKHRLGFATAKFREAFGYLFSALTDNFCGLVVDSEAERLRVDGFRSSARDESDAEAWRIWQANHLDAVASIAHTEALAKGVSYVSVWDNPRDRQTPRIRVEDALQTVVWYDVEDPSVRVAALKSWISDDGYVNANLFLPDRVEKYRSAKPLTRFGSYWTPWSLEGAAWGLVEAIPNGMDTIPIVPFVNNPLVTMEGRSEIASVIPIQDMINKLIADMLVSSEFVSFPQRWATGLEIPQDETGKDIEPFQAAVDRLWTSDSDKTVFGQFTQGSLDPYVKAIEMLVQHIASITKTPPHYLLGQSGSFPSGEALKATETGLVSKVKRAQLHFGEAWEEVIELAFRARGERRDLISEVRWADPESRIMSELADALGKLKVSLNLPDEFLWEKYGLTQAEIVRVKTMQAETLLLAPPALAEQPPAQQPPGVLTTATLNGGNSR